MRIETFDPATEPDKVKTCYEMYVAGLPVDDPDGPPLPEESFSGWMREGWSGERRETALASDENGDWVGAYVLELPDRRNKNLGFLVLQVAPGLRRRGYGTALLRHAASCADRHGRTLLTGETLRGAPGSAFASAVGARAGVIDVRRVLEVASVPAGRLAALRREAEAAARGYLLISWRGPTAEEHLPGVATVSAAMADAPRNPGHEKHRPDIQRVRDFERRSTELGMRRYSVAAICDQTGELAGLTQLGVDSYAPSWGFQFITAVTRQHRGHRLGLLVKVAMLEMLVSAEPGMSRIMTGNADGNQHMIAINTELGFRILDEQQTWDLDVAAVLAAGGTLANNHGHPGQ
jgi:GNAT superfamily N-acetyltransferase